MRNSGSSDTRETEELVLKVERARDMLSNLKLTGHAFIPKVLNFDEKIPQYLQLKFKQFFIQGTGRMFHQEIIIFY